MNYVKTLTSILMLTLLLSSCSTTQAPPDPEAPVFQFTEENFPRLDGSTATIPLGEAVQSVLLGKPRDACQVAFNTTTHAYYMLSDQEADLLLVYDGGEETKESVQADTAFETAPIGLDALVFLVNADNPVDDLSSQQVRDIFSGAITNWSEVGGNDELIRAYQRTEGSGSQALMDKLVMRGLEMGSPQTIPFVSSMSGLVDVIASFDAQPTGIGYNVFYYVTQMYENPDIKILSIDGVLPSYETIQDGSYPFVSEFYSIIRTSEPEDSPARILHQWLQSPAGQQLIQAEHYVAMYDGQEGASS